MPYEKVKGYFDEIGLPDRITVQIRRAVLTRQRYG